MIAAVATASYDVPSTIERAGLGRVVDHTDRHEGLKDKTRERASSSAHGCSRFASVGSEEAPNEGLASVRRTNRTYSFPVSGFHERAFAICSEGMSETRLTSLNSVRNRLVGYSLHAALRHRLVRCDHSRRMIQPSS
jgi:hypothetical protein